METLYTILENLYLTYFSNETIYSVMIALNWVCFLIMIILIFMPIIMFFSIIFIIRKIKRSRGYDYD
jgi:hypothetical protein